MPDVSVRLFRPEDSDALAALFFRTVRRVNRRDYTQEQLEAWAPSDRDLDAWRKSFNDRKVFVAESRGVIAGFGELESNEHIDRFYIDADFIGQGVGRAIYIEIEREARLALTSVLFVEASLTARSFFEAMGFAVIKRQTVSRRGVSLDNFVMEKKL